LKEQIKDKFETQEQRSLRSFNLLMEMNASLESKVGDFMKKLEENETKQDEFIESWKKFSKRWKKSHK